MRKWLVAALAALVVFTAGQACAEDWPTHTLTMINPFAAGGPNDVPARLFAQRMGEILGQSIIVENVGGAGGMNGAERVAKAAPDGYTFLVGTVGTQAQNQTLYKKPTYDATKADPSSRIPAKAVFAEARARYSGRRKARR